MNTHEFNNTTHHSEQPTDQVAPTPPYLTCPVAIEKGDGSTGCLCGKCEFDDFPDRHPWAIALRILLRAATDQYVGRNYSNEGMRLLFTLDMAFAVALTPDLSAADRAGRALYHLAWLAAHFADDEDIPDDLRRRFESINETVGEIAA